MSAYHGGVSRTKVIALSVLGIVLPVALAFTAFLISRSTIGTAGTVPSLTHSPARASAANTESPTPKASATRTEDGSSGPGSASTSAPSTESTATPSDDHGGKCSEPEHVNDPSCIGDDSSGKGGGGSSGSSGHGGGDD